MRSVILGAMLICSVMVAVSTLGQSPPQVYGHDAAPQSGGLLAFSSDAANGRQQVAVIDTKSRVMSVYHVEYASGGITLKSVRNLHADLLLDEYNTSDPLPREIRAMLSQGR